MSQFVLFLGLGLAAGVLYTGVGLGVVTTFRATGVVNLAQVGFGMWGAFTFGQLTQNGQLVLPIPGLPTPSLGGPATALTALAISVAMTALLGGLSYLLIFRPLRRASTVTNLVASTGLLAVLQSLIILQFGDVAVPVNPFLSQGTVSVAGAAIPADRLWAAAIAVVVTAAMAAWFRWARTGLAMRGASESHLHVALARWSPDRLALMGWVLGPVIGAGLTIVVAPSVSLSPVAFGLLIVPGLAAALVGRLSSVVATCVGGLLLGMIQSEIGNWSTKAWWPGWARVGVSELVPLLAVVAVLILRGSSLPFRGEPMGSRLPKVSSLRPRPSTVAVGAAIGVVLLVTTTGSYRFGVITSMVLAILFLSVVVLTGFTGQLSLAQAAVAGVGGFALAKLGTGVPFPINLVLAALIATVAGVVIGAPALRIRGAQLAIVSMAGALVLEQLVFDNPSFAPQGGEPIPPAHLFGLDLAVRSGDDIARLSFGLTVLVVLVVVSWAVACVAAGRTGRRFTAIRSNERAAAAAGVSVAQTKLVAVATASFLAGLSGGLLGLVRGELTADSFTLFVGITAVAFTVIGGITRVSGAMVAGALGSLGILYVILDQQLSFGKWYGLGAGLALVVTVVLNPEGIAGSVAGWFGKVRLRWGRTVGRPGRATAPALATAPGVGWSGDATPTAPAPTFPAAERPCVLTVTGLHVAYGGVVAVDDVSFEARGGRIVGLIGPNGAGKTSLLDAVCGFTPSGGTVTLDGVDLVGRSPHQRQRAGLGRTWQDGGLFDDLSVIDNLAVSAEPARLGDLGRDLFSLPVAERRRLAEVLEAWGIADLAHRRPGELSIGQRKMVGIARAAASDPAVLLADEPAAGLDRREGDDLGRRLRAYAESGRAVVLIEHDLSLVRSVCDHLVVLDFGAVIAEGAPEEVLADPLVISVYLGVSPEEVGPVEPARLPGAGLLPRLAPEEVSS
ncbi:MAG: ABC transporter permease subunit [Acidimicrobiales bacterium]